MQPVSERGIGVGVLLAVLVVLGQGKLMAEPPQPAAKLFWEDSSETNIPILPSGKTTLGEIRLRGAPPAAIVAGMDVQVSIIHPHPEKLTIRLADQADAYNVPIESRLDGAGFRVTFSKTDTRRFDGEEVNQKWRLIVQDNSTPAKEDRYIDSWRVRVFYAEPNAPPNDESNRTIRLFPRWAYCGWTYGADGQDLTAAFAGDTADVWHEFTAPQSREYALSLGGSIPVKTVAVFDGLATDAALAYGETTVPDIPAVVRIPMAQGKTYMIRVASLPRMNGNYVICISPVGPIEPHPENGQVHVPTDVVLSWDGVPRPADNPPQGVAAPAPVPSDILPGSLRIAGISGSDDRQDEYEVQDPEVLAVGDSTVALVRQSDLQPTPGDTFILSAPTLAESYRPLCPEEPYGDQPLAASCSGFLVAPDVIATAGHCTVCTGSSCISDAAVVFGFAVIRPGQTRFEIPASDVYACREIIAFRYAPEADWALVRLDREVTGHTPLRVRRRGSVSIGDPLLLIGHPTGLPRKYAPGGIVRASDPTLSYFETDLDTYPGNSGSAVFSALTFEVEGIDFRGGDWSGDFVKVDGCYRSAWWPETRNWSLITRASEFAELIPAFEVYLGTDPGRHGVGAGWPRLAHVRRARTPAPSHLLLASRGNRRLWPPARPGLVLYHG